MSGISGGPMIIAWRKASRAGLPQGRATARMAAVAGGWPLGRGPVAGKGCVERADAAGDKRSGPGQTARV